MEDWLMNKKLEEAERIAQLRDIDNNEEIYSCIRDQAHTTSFKKFLRS